MLEEKEAVWLSLYALTSYAASAIRTNSWWARRPRDNPLSALITSTGLCQRTWLKAACWYMSLGRANGYWPAFWLIVDRRAMHLAVEMARMRDASCETGLCSRRRPSSASYYNVGMTSPHRYIYYVCDLPQSRPTCGRQRRQALACSWP